MVIHKIITGRGKWSNVRRNRIIKCCGRNSCINIPKRVRTTVAPFGTTSAQFTSKTELTIESKLNATTSFHRDLIEQTTSEYIATSAPDETEHVSSMPTEIKFSDVTTTSGTEESITSTTEVPSTEKSQTDIKIESN